LSESSQNAPQLRSQEVAHACDGICTGVKCGLYELENTQSLAGDFNLT
jgi:hypothetical protein